MNEEIDIIELLKRVKEGKAPKKIQMGDWVYDLVDCDYGEKNYVRNKNIPNYREIMFTEDFQCFELLDTKIKILDKPIIEELRENDMFVTVKVGNKINEIIRHINNE